VSTPKATWGDILYGKNNDRQWWRVVLDEAQMVADSSSLRSSNVADLESHSRWCVSGTPLNNNLEDFSGLLSFISRGTFNDNQVLKNEMLTPFRNRQPVGLRRMKGLLASIMWRHSKARVSDELDKEEFSKVPATVTNVLTVQFSPEER
jgi:SNF2 family DNA or RNA helicase